jgi:hypothetical protein
MVVMGLEDIRRAGCKIFLGFWREIVPGDIVMRLAEPVGMLSGNCGSIL